ncbi:MAG: hypothetical protein ACI9BW_002905 [Gammaproteobacteria bacterium]|jgi:hypothetical protein
MTEDQNNLDPVRLMREWYIKSEKMWSDSLTEMMGDERFSEGLGRNVNEALHSHRMFSESMGQFLSNINVPSRGDVLDMGDRLAHIEDTLNQIQVELRAQRTQLAKFVPGGEEKARKRPSRTKKPADEPR